MKRSRFFHRMVNSSKWDRVKTYCWDVFINGFSSMYVVPCSLRRFILNAMRIGEIKGVVHANCYIASAKLWLGTGSYINRNCLLDNKNAKIVIGKNVAIAFNVKLLTTHHTYGDPGKRSGGVIGKPIGIDDGAWIGANVTVLPGCIVGRGCVIAAGAVVGGICEPNCLYAGIPAKKIREFDHS